MINGSPNYAKGEQGLTIVFERLLTSLWEWIDQTFSNFPQFVDGRNIALRSKGAIFEGFDGLLDFYPRFF